MIRVVSAPYVLLGDVNGARRQPLAPPGTMGHEVVIRDGAVALDGDHLVEVGSRAELEPRYGPGERLDAVILPALVNAHLHLELSHLAGRVLGGEGLAPWIELLVSARARAREEGAHSAMAEAVQALRRAGVAAVGEVTNTLASLPHLAAAGVAGTLFHEVFGFSAERIEEALAAASAMRARAGKLPAGLRVIPSPHAVYSTHPATFSALLRRGPASVHLAEDPAERAFCARGEGPFATIARRLGARDGDLGALARSAVATAAPHLHAGSLAVHLVDLDSDDLRLLARSGTTAVLCPRSNLHIGGNLPDLPRLLDAGIPLAVGTDSLASSPSLSPLAELAALRNAFPAIDATRLLALAWNGAAVGAPAVGRLAPGTTPGIVAAPLEGARPGEPCAWLIEAFGACERPFAWIADHRPGVSAP